MYDTEYQRFAAASGTFRWLQLILELHYYGLILHYFFLPHCGAIATGHMLTSNLKIFSFTSLFVRVMSLFQLAGSLHIGHASISLVLIIGFLCGPAVSNDQDF